MNFAVQIKLFLGGNAGFSNSCLNSAQAEPHANPTEAGSVYLVSVPYYTQMKRCCEDVMASRSHMGLKYQDFRTTDVC